MIEKRNSLTDSHVNRASIEMPQDLFSKFEEEKTTNGSITDFVLKQKGIESIAHNFLIDKSKRMPINVLRELVLIDNLKIDESTKKKIFAFRLWAEEGKYDHVREYLPEGTIGLEDIQARMPSSEKRDEFIHIKRLEDLVDQVIKDEGKLGKTYHLLHEASDIADELIPVSYGFNYIRRYELLTKIAIEQLKGIEIENLSNEIRQEIVNKTLIKYSEEATAIKNNVRSEIYSEKRRQIDESKLIYLRNNEKLTRKEIATRMDKSLRWVRDTISKLYKQGKIKKSRPYNRNRYALRQGIIEYSTNYAFNNPKKRISVEIMKRYFGSSFNLTKEVYLCLLDEGYDLPMLESSRKKYNRVALEAQILNSIEGYSLVEPINLIEIYEKANFSCSRMTFYNAYHELATRITLPPVRHGGKRK